MTRLLASGLMLLALAVAGCGGGGGAGPANPAEAEPLTVEQWRTMPEKEKYADETMARLMNTNPEFEDTEAWETFLRDVVVPERAKDRGSNR